MATIPTWSYKQGGSKAGFHCRYVFSMVLNRGKGGGGGGDDQTQKGTDLCCSIVLLSHLTEVVCSWQ